MSPKEDFFASAGLDGTVRVWDLRTTNCQGLMRFGADGHGAQVAFDPHGLVFAAGTSYNGIKARSRKAQFLALNTPLSSSIA